MDGSLRSAELVVPVIMNLLQPRSVVDLGCGVGTWLHVFKNHGVKKVLGVDGGYVPKDKLLIGYNEFLTADLSKALKINDFFDLVVSLEAGEHIPSTHAKFFIRSITKLSQLVLFSSAVPCQGGINHINEQWPSYWESIFAEFGFIMFDPIRPLIWKDLHIEYWYRQNIFMFANVDLIESKPEIKRLVNENKPNDLMIVHPGILDRLSGVRPFFKRLPKTIKRRLTNRHRREPDCPGRH